MSQDGDTCYEEAFSSFLAGVFLTRKRIKNYDFMALMNEFEEKYNVSILSLGGDIYLPIYFDDNEMVLYKDIDDVILVDGKEKVIRDYLYSFVTLRVREFFSIPEIEVKEKKTFTLIKKLFGGNSTIKKIAM